jgi:hypothetical protein
MQPKSSMVGLTPTSKNGVLTLGGNPGTEEITVQVHEMIKGGDFKTIYDSMSDNLDALCLSQGQIKSFVKKYRNWLRADGYGTFFLFKAGAKFFVVSVHFRSVKCEVHISHFLNDQAWSSENRLRFVLPQPSA